MESKLFRPHTTSAPSLFSPPSKPNFAFQFPRKHFVSVHIPTTNVVRKRRYVSVHASGSSPGSMPTKKRIDESKIYTLDYMSRFLTLHDDSIISSLMKRAQYCYNANTYDPHAFSMNGFHGSLLEHTLRETEKIHAEMALYMSPDEHPFFPDGLPEPLFSPPLDCQHEVLHPIAKKINVNDRAWEVYFRDLIPRLVPEGDDGNYVSTAICDTTCLQTLSKRIHYGKFVAEAKFQASPDAYKDAIIAQDRDKLMDLVTNSEVQEAIERSVGTKTKNGTEVFMNRKDDEAERVYKMKRNLVTDLYRRWIMPLTKEVQVAYLLRRLDQV